MRPPEPRLSLTKVWASIQIAMDHQHRSIHHRRHESSELGTDERELKLIRYVS